MQGDYVFNVLGDFHTRMVNTKCKKQMVKLVGTISLLNGHLLFQL